MRAILRAAVSGGFVNAVRLLLSGEEDVNEVSMVVVGCHSASACAVRCVIVYVTMAGYLQVGDTSPLVMASDAGHADVVACLLELGANVNQCCGVSRQLTSLVSPSVAVSERRLPLLFLEA